LRAEREAKKAALQQIIDNVVKPGPETNPSNPNPQPEDHKAAEPVKKHQTLSLESF
jgi:hypothetical protein